jgi:iron(III) transport system permease protein
MSTRDRIRDAYSNAAQATPSPPVSRQLVLGTIILAVVVLTVVPLVFLLWTSVWSSFPGDLGASFTLENFEVVYLEGFFDVEKLFLNSLTIAVGMTITGIVFGLTFAWLFVRTNVPMKGSMELVLLSGQAIPGYVIGIMYIIAYRPERGLVPATLEETIGVGFVPIDIFSPWGVAFVAGVNVVSTAYLLTVPALQDMDSALEEVSRIHGANILQTVRSITFPLITPAILSAVITTFLYGMGEFAIVSVLGSRQGFDVYSTIISEAIKNRFPAAYGEAAALSCSLLLVTAIMVWYYRRVTSRKADYMTLTGKRTQNQRWDLGKWRWPISGVLWVALLVVWVIPIAAMVIASLTTTWTGTVVVDEWTLTHYAAAIADQQLWDAFANSVFVSVGAATLGTILVVGLAYYTERTRARFRGFVDMLSLTPLAVPGIIIGAGLIFASLWAGKLPFVNLYGTLTIIIIGSVIVFLPVSSRIAVGNIVQIHSELEEAARVAGASWLQQIRQIFLPLFRNTAIVIWFFLLVHVFQLLSIAWMTYTTDTVVIPVKLFQLYMYEPALSLVAAISTIFVVLTVLLVLAMRLAGITFYDLGQR